MGCGGTRWVRPGWGWNTGQCGAPVPPGFPPVEGTPHPAGDYSGKQGFREAEIVRQELQKLYARGKISRSQYLAAMDRLATGSFTLDDLWQLREQREGEAGGVKASHDRDDITILQRKKNEVEQAAQEIAQAAESLAQSMDRLKRETRRQEDLARALVATDEAQARSHLERRQAMAEQLASLEARLKDLRSDQERLQNLAARLDAKIMERQALAKDAFVGRLEAEVERLDP